MNTERVCRLRPVLTRFVPGFRGVNGALPLSPGASNSQKPVHIFLLARSAARGTLTIRLMLNQCWLMTGGPGPREPPAPLSTVGRHRCHVVRFDQDRAVRLLEIADHIGPHR